MIAKNASDERYYLPEELAEEWGVSAETIEQVFSNEPGVLKFVIPESVAVRVHQRILATIPGAEKTEPRITPASTIPGICVCQGHTPI